MFGGNLSKDLETLIFWSFMHQLKETFLLLITLEKLVQWEE